MNVTLRDGYGEPRVKLSLGLHSLSHALPLYKRLVSQVVSAAKHFQCQTISVRMFGGVSIRHADKSTPGRWPVTHPELRRRATNMCAKGRQSERQVASEVRSVPPACTHSVELSSRLYLLICSSNS